MPAHNGGHCSFSGRIVMLETYDQISRQTVQSPMRALTAGRLELTVANTAEELEGLQRLRFKVFSEEMSAVFPPDANGLDADEYDAWCEHLIVRDQTTGKIVGTYRLLTPQSASRLGGFYSESEFDLSALQGIRHQVLELGRSCIHRDYRNGVVIMLLWAGIASVVQRLGLRYVLGCASVSLRDGGATAAHVWREVLSGKHAASHAYRVRPLHPYPIDRLDSELPARTPPLIKGYLKAGARVCGEPAWDPDFNSADFPVLLDVMDMDPRYRRHLGVD